MSKETLLNVFKAHEGKALKARALASLTGLSERMIRKYCVKLTKELHPIVTGDTGYTYNAPTEDALRMVQRLMAHSREEKDRAKMIAKVYGIPLHKKKEANPAQMALTGF